MVLKFDDDMKKTIRYFAALVLSAAAVVSCYKDGTDFPSTETRITVYPEIPVFNADGTTQNGEDSYVCAVTVFSGTSVSDMSWKAEPMTDKDWATVSDASLVMQYTDYSMNVHDVAQPGFEVAMDPNHSYKRVFDVKVTASDGTSRVFSFTQLGEKADAEVTTSVASLDIPAVGGESDVIEYTTNMNKYSYSIAYEGEDKDWLQVVDKGIGKVALKAAAWTDMTRGRSAVLTITVGTPDTSEASVDIPVNQLKNDIFYYAYGPSISTERVNALQMEKLATGVYSVKTFTFDAGTNYICFNKDSRSESYPCWYLANDGSIKEATAAVTTSDLAIAANGVYTITADFNTMKWTMDKSIKVSSCMPDSELSKYGTKTYPTRDGGSKTWMTTSLHWDGGFTGLKLGCGIAPGHGAGAYSEITTSTSVVKRAENETIENGGTLSEMMAKDGVTTLANKFGRLYCQTEIYTGTAKGGLEDRQWINFPWGEPGDEYTDDAGNTMTLECVLATKLAAYEASAAGDALAETENPTLKIQIQGICPFGWHVANMQDWRDLIWATSQDGATDYPVDPVNATYSKIGSVLKLPNVASHLYGTDWAENTTLPAKPAQISSAAAAFGWNMFPTGWRLISSGWAYGPDDESSKPAFLSTIPLMADSNGDGLRHRSWRVVVTGQGNILQFAATQVVGEGSATAYRCVKNYKTK